MACPKVSSAERDRPIAMSNISVSRPDRRSVIGTSLAFDGRKVAPKRSCSCALSRARATRSQLPRRDGRRRDPGDRLILALRVSLSDGGYQSMIASGGSSVIHAFRLFSFTRSRSKPRPPRSGNLKRPPSRPGNLKPPPPPPSGTSPPSPPTIPGAAPRWHGRSHPSRRHRGLARDGTAPAV